MEFTNLFSPVHLSEDPSFGSNGQLYFNTASNVYRIYYEESWISLVDTDGIPRPQTFILGDRLVPNFSVTIFPNYYNNTVVALSASSNNFIIEPSGLGDVPAGTYVDIIRGGPGIVTLEAEDGVILHEPSPIYLTAVWQSVRITKIADNEWVVGGEFPDIY